MKNRFVTVRDPINYKYVLMIENYSWWHDNHFDVIDWMRANLPRGEDYCKGMVIQFDSEQERTWFLLRWA
jgi:hypothetical protein